MLNDNIRALRKAKGLSQEDLAVRLNVVRQTISKWEQGLSVPDSEMLVTISQVFETPVSTLLGEEVPLEKPDDLKVISEKLEIINYQLLQRKNAIRIAAHVILIIICVGILLIFAGLYFLNSTYLKWDYNNPEMAVIGTFLHSFEWLYVRIAPIILILSFIGVILTRKKS